MTRYYYQWQTDSFLEGTTEELKRYHMDYAPGDTKQDALNNAREYFTEKQNEYQQIVDRMRNRYFQVLRRNDKL